MVPRDEGIRNNQLCLLQNAESVKNESDDRFTTRWSIYQYYQIILQKITRIYPTKRGSSHAGHAAKSL